MTLSQRVPMPLLSHYPYPPQEIAVLIFLPNRLSKSYLRGKEVSGSPFPPRAAECF